MSRPLSHDDVFATSLVRYGEHDCIVRLFGREQGRFSAFSKSGLKPSKTRGGVVQVPSRARVGFHLAEGDGLSRLRDFDVAPYTLQLSDNLRMFGWACYLMEISEVFLPEYEPQPQYFDLLDEATRMLASKAADNLLLRAMELKLLAICGYLPDLSGAVDDHASPVVAFDPTAGHLLAHQPQDALPFSELAREAAILLCNAPLSQKFSFDDETCKMVSRLFASRLRLIHKHPLKSVQFLKSCG